jgi:hypothetical protein
MNDTTRTKKKRELSWATGLTLAMDEIAECPGQPKENSKSK